MRLLSSVLYSFLYTLKHRSVKRVLIAAGILLAVDFLLFGFFWWPAAWHHHELQKQIDQVRFHQQEAQQALETAQDYVSLTKLSKSLESKLETPTTQSKLIEFLTRLASQNSLKVISQDFDSKEEGPAGAFKQNVNLEGTYTSVRHYLSDLENLPTLTLVRQIRMESAGEESGRVRVFLTLLTLEKSSMRGR